MLMSSAGERCFVGCAGAKAHSMSLPSSASLSLPFSVALGVFPPLLVLVLLYPPFLFSLSLCLPLLYFTFSIQFLTLLLCCSF